MSQRPKLPKWLIKPYGTSSLSTMGYPIQSSGIKAITSRVSWWLTSVSWWECRKCRLAHTISRPTASVRDLITLWSICLGFYPRKRSQSRKITLECWSMYTTVPKTQPQVQPLLPHVQETASSSYQCYLWFGSTNHYKTKYYQIHAENKGMHLVGS